MTTDREKATQYVLSNGGIHPPQGYKITGAVILHQGLFLGRKVVVVKWTTATDSVLYEKANSAHRVGEGYDYFWKCITTEIIHSPMIVCVYLDDVLLTHRLFGSISSTCSCEPNDNTNTWCSCEQANKSDLVNPYRAKKHALGKIDRYVAKNTKFSKLAWLLFWHKPAKSKSVPEYNLESWRQN